MTLSLSNGRGLPTQPPDLHTNYPTAYRTLTFGFTEGNIGLVLGATRTIEPDRPSYRTLHAGLEGVPIVTVLGSHKDLLRDTKTGQVFSPVTNQSRRFLAALSGLCVANNVSIQNGGAKTGVMGASSEEFVAAVSALGPDKPTQSRLILQPLHFLRPDSNEPPSRLGSPGCVSQTHGSFLTRTPGMFGLGIPTISSHFIGGLGVAEEFWLGPAAATTGDRVHGPYHLRSAPACFFVANDTLEGRVPDGYFSGFQQLVRTQVDLGLVRNDVAGRFFFSKLENPEEDVGLLEPILREARGSKPACSPLANRQAEVRRVLWAISRRGEEVRNLIEKAVPACESTFLLVFLGHVYTEFLARQAERADGVATGAQFQELVEASVGRFRALTNFLIETPQRPTVQLVGFNKNLAPRHHQLQVWFEHFAKALAAGTADRDMDFMVTGDGRNGIQKATYAAWEGKASARAGSGRPTGTRYVRVQMDLDGEVTAPLKGSSGLRETLLPAMVSLESTAALVSLVGRPKVYVVCCPGPVEMYREVASTLLYRQLKDLVLNGFTNCRDLPKIFFVSPKSSSMTGYWFDGLQVQFRTFERFSATYPGNFDGITYMRFGDASDLTSATIAARSILRSLDLDPIMSCSPSRVG